MRNSYLNVFIIIVHILNCNIFFIYYKQNLSICLTVPFFENFNVFLFFLLSTRFFRGIIASVVSLMMQHINAVRNCVMVARMTLTHFVWVRILVPQPVIPRSFGGFYFYFKIFY